MANTSGFDGAGMVIAVLDTGLEVNHKSFQGAPENPALTQSDIAAVLSDKALNAEEKKPGRDGKPVYRSAKVPFAFDYADNDTDVTPGSARRPRRPCLRHRRRKRRRGRRCGRALRRRHRSL